MLLTKLDGGESTTQVSKNDEPGSIQVKKHSTMKIPQILEDVESNSFSRKPSVPRLSSM